MTEQYFHAMILPIHPPTYFAPFAFVGGGHESLLFRLFAQLIYLFIYLTLAAFILNTVAVFAELSLVMTKTTMAGDS